jgi:hypothetical protein
VFVYLEIFTYIWYNLIILIHIIWLLILYRKWICFSLKDSIPLKWNKRVLSIWQFTFSSVSLSSFTGYLVSSRFLIIYLHFVFRLLLLLLLQMEKRIKLLLFRILILMYFIQKQLNQQFNWILRIMMSWFFLLNFFLSLSNLIILIMHNHTTQTQDSTQINLKSNSLIGLYLSTIYILEKVENRSWILRGSMVRPPNKMIMINCSTLLS